MRLLPLAALVLVLAGCGGGEQAFDYDRAAPLALRQASVADVAGVTVRDVSFASGADRVPAFLVEPSSAGPHAGVLFLHGSGGSRDDFLSEAVALAQDGVVGLTLTSAYERSTDLRVRRNVEPVAVDRELWLRAVVDVRRALDLLRARPDVDPDRLGLVGYSRGSHWAALAAAVEHPRAVVLMGAPSRPSTRVLPAADRGLVEPLDTVRYVGRLAPTALLLQGARYDQAVPPSAVRDLFAAARDPKELRWYPTGHEFDGNALEDQLGFLRRELEVER